MAKRIQFAAYGGPEVLEYRDYQPAEPGPREVRVRNRAIGLNFIDTYYRSGLYPAPGLPSGLGSEGAGEVEAVVEVGSHGARLASGVGRGWGRRRFVRRSAEPFGVLVITGQR